MKENLLRAKRLLEKKYFASDDASEYQVEPYLGLAESIDNEGVFNHIQNYINGTREYCARNGIEYDEIHLYPRFALYFNSKYADKYPYTIENKIKMLTKE